MSGERKTEPLYKRDGQCSSRSQIHSAYPHPLHPLHVPLVCRTARQQANPNLAKYFCFILLPGVNPLD